MSLLAESTALEPSRPGDPQNGFRADEPSPSLPPGFPLQLRAGIRVAESDGAVWVGRSQMDDSGLRLSGTGISSLLRLLDGTSTLQALLEALPEPAHPSLLQLLERLREADLLEPWADGTRADRVSPVDAPTVRCLHDLADRMDLDLDGPTLFQILRRAEVQVEGDPLLVGPLAEALRVYGIEARRPGRPDLVIVAATGNSADEVFRAFAESGAENARPWLPVLFEGLDLRIGPWIAHDGAPCYECSRLRRLANSQMPEGSKVLHPDADDLPSHGSLRLSSDSVALEVVRILVDRHSGRAPELHRLIKDFRRPNPVPTSHVVLPVPFCPSCHVASAPPIERPTPPRLPGPEVSDPLCGIVKTQLSMPVEPDDPPVFYIATEATNSKRFGTGIPDFARFGCGVDVDHDAAVGAALGEILERYSAAHYDPSRLRFAAFHELEGEALDPETFAGFSPDQYERVSDLPQRFTRDTQTGWVQGRSLVDGRAIWVPAPFVYLPYRYSPGETYLGDSLSTGIACGLNREAAVLNALYEVIERDTTSITWLARLAPTALDLEPGSALHELQSRLATPDMELRLLDLTLDTGIPTIAAFLLHERGGTVVGTATRLDPREAARKALLEAIQGQLVWKKWLKDGPQYGFAEDFYDVLDYTDHPRAYMAPHMRSRLDFLWSSDSRCSIAELPQETGDPGDLLETCVEALVGVGLEPVVVDVTSPDVKGLGYWVQRVLVPGMSPLNARHDAPYLRCPRLYEVPERSTGRAVTADSLNVDPHPFP